MMNVDRSMAGQARAIGEAQAQSTADLRILFVVDSRFPGLGGAESQAVKLAHALKDRGVHVEYVAPMVNAGEYDIDNYDGIPIRFIEYPHVKYLGSLFMMSKFALFLVRNKNEFDFMHVHVTRLLAATAGLVRPFSNIPIVTKISGYFEFEGGVLDQRKRLNPINALMRLALRNVDYVQTISKEAEQKLLEAGFKPQQIALIPNGIDTSSPPAPMPESDVFTMGYCGRLREIKGVHVLLKGYAKCKAQRPDANMRVVLAGGGTFEQELRALAAQLNITNDIEFLGTIEDTASFYGDLDLYIQPSYVEGLPNSVIEAMHAARAVVATDIGGNNDLIEENVAGHLFPAGDDEKLGELLVKCFDDQNDNLRLGKAGRAIIEQRYGMDSVINQLVGVYSGR